MESHPAWVRGLKLCRRKNWSMINWSHPAWVRGLKLLHEKRRSAGTQVAPRVGAWIETNQHNKSVR